MLGILSNCDAGGGVTDDGTSDDCEAASLSISDLNDADVSTGEPGPSVGGMLTSRDGAVEPSSCGVVGSSMRRSGRTSSRKPFMATACAECSESEAILLRGFEQVDHNRTSIVCGVDRRD